jgi:hypothetical protein
MACPSDHHVARELRGATGVNIYLECPSPNHSVVAVLWSESGRGAAGWSQQLLSIQPADVPIEHTPDRQMRNESTVLAVNHGETYELKWQGDDHLVVTVAYSDQADVYSLSHSRMIGGNRIRVTFQELRSERHPFSSPRVRCESGSQVIENPPPRRLK